ncbi:MAG: hypothetical protein ACTHLT_19465 [Devosia sp.]
MDKIFTVIRHLLAGLLEPETPADPLNRMTPRELADLPVHHPRDTA